MEDVCVGDVSLPLDEVTRALGPVDVLVNAHSISPNRPLIDADESDVGPHLCGQEVSGGSHTGRPHVPLPRPPA
jgi:hypothetical protein